ncbi:hypothetical protein G6F46_000768 [Rhizopus delemar]|nr:hypothetical protein G6F46_000768 [Rhizopus delemar]
MNLDETVNNEVVRGTVNLAQVRSRSYEHPKTDYMSSLPTGNNNHAHFSDLDTMPNAKPRPRNSRMNTTGQIRSRPKLSSRAASIVSPVSRNSMIRNLSTFSLYSNFAGERLEENQNRQRPTCVDEEKCKNNASRRSSLKNKTEVSVMDEESFVESDENDKPKASFSKAMFMFLKAFIGSGVLFLPKAFQNGGLALSIVLMVIIAAICLVAFQRLVNTQLSIGGSYGDVGGILYGQWIRFIVLFFIVISQIGFVCSYFIFVSGNLVNAVDVLSNCTSNIAEKYYIWFPLVILIPCALVRHIARLSFAIILADILILFGLICVIYFTADQLKNVGIGPNIAAVNPQNFALMIGTATFSFEGIGLIIPIVESMKRPEKFPLVLTLGISGKDSMAVKWSKNMYRVIISIVCAVISFGVGGDNLDKFVSLVGSVACVPLCFIFPGMFHWKMSSKTTDRAVDSFLMVFGAGIMIYTLYITINSFVHPQAAGESIGSYCPA